MNRFSKLHPILHLVFYSLTLIFVLIASNPFFSASSLLGAFLYNAVICKGRVLKNLWLSVVIILFVGVFNMLFAHYGADVLFTIKNTAFTLEALMYGINQGIVFSGVMLWFTALSYNSDGDRVLYLFSFAPRLALMFSIILGFIPRFNKKLKDIRDAQKALRGGISPGGLRERYKSSLNNLSALITYSLESSIITADSMTARGYRQGALSVKRYSLCAEDFVLLSAVVICFGAVFYFKAAGAITFIFDPVIKVKSFSAAALVLFIIAEMIPFFVEIWEGMLWKLSNARV